MGSFNVACSISDLTIISGDEMYIQLLLPTWVLNPYSIDAEKTGCSEKGVRVSNEGSMGEFVPFGFPIYMDYEDSGHGDINVRDRNVEMLEEFFGIPIELIVSCAEDYSWYKYTYKPAIEEGKKEEYKGKYDNWVMKFKDKIKNIDILKKITLTYFKKEHYDFLAEKIRGGGDSYFDSEREKKLTNMLSLLSELDKKRPKEGEFKVFSHADITDEMRKTYQEYFTDPMGDDEIVMMENMDARKWWSGFTHKFYIPSICDYDMFQLLPIGEKDADNVKKHFYFLSNLYNLTRALRPSYYASQHDNHKAYVDFCKMSAEQVSKKVVERKNDTILDEIKYVLNNSLKGLNDKKLEQQIKDDINAELELYGYEIKF